MAFSLSALASTVQTFTLDQFNLDLSPGFTTKYGGTATVKSIYTPDFQVNISGYDQAFDFPKVPVNDWITPMLGSGVTFASVTNFGVWGPWLDVYQTSIGIGFASHFPNTTDPYEIPFYVGLAHWDITVTTPVPEPSSYAMMFAGLMLMASMMYKRNQVKKS